MPGVVTLAQLEAAERDLPGATLQQLAEHLGVSTKSLYRRRLDRAAGRPGPVATPTAPGTSKAWPPRSRGSEAWQARERAAPNSTDLVWTPPPASAEPPSDGRLQLIYGYDAATREPFRDVLGCLLVAGDRGMGKSAALAYLGQQAERLGARLVPVDLHAYEPESATRRLGRDPATVATDRPGAWETIGRVRLLMVRRLSGQDPDRWPVVLLVDEYPAVSYPPTAASKAAVADLLAIAQEGRKAAVHVWIGTTSVAGEGSGLPQNLRQAIVARVLLRCANTTAAQVAGHLSALPGRAPSLTHGRAFVLTEHAPEWCSARLPLPTADGSPAGLPPELPAADVHGQRRELDAERGRWGRRIERARAGLRDLAHQDADELHGILSGALSSVKQAAGLAELLDVAERYLSDVERAEALTPRARAGTVPSAAATSAERRSVLAWLRDWWDNLDTGLPQLYDQEPDDDDQDDDEADRTAPRPLYVVDVPEPAAVQAEARERAMRRPHRGPEVWRPGWGRSSTSAEILDAEAECERQAERERFGY